MDGSVYLRTPGAHPVSWANLFTDLCRLLPKQTAEPLLQRYRDPHETPTGLMLALLEAFPTGRSVVLLDNFDDLLDPITGAVTEGALDEALRAVLSAPAHGVTSRHHHPDRAPAAAAAPRRPAAADRSGRRAALPVRQGPAAGAGPGRETRLKTAPAAQLALARERTRGYPRALEALAGILSADRNTTLPELLDQTAGLPDNVVEALVGEAFLRLDPLAQQIIQALAIFPVPVPAVAIDYLLQPYQPAINAAPVLARLVNMPFVRRDAGHYYLHQVDRDYALGRIPDGRAHRPRRRPAAVHPHRALPPRRRLLHPNPQTAPGAENPRRPRPATGRVRTALSSRRLRNRRSGPARHRLRLPHPVGPLPLHHRPAHPPARRLTDPVTRVTLARRPRPLPLPARGLRPRHPAARTNSDPRPETGDRSGEAAVLGNLGLCYADVGQTHRAIDMHESRLGHRREVGERDDEAAHP